MTLLDIILLTIVLIIMVPLTYYDLKSFYSSDRYHDYKGVIVTIGILGTFTGILLSLFAFDGKATRVDLKQLLVGMKFAFLTSVVGMAVSIVLTIFQKMWPRERIEDGMVNEELQKASLNIQSMAYSLYGINKGVHGDKAFDKLKEIVEQGIEDSSKRNLKSVSELLDGIADRFASSLEAQFGRSFSDLNDAISQIVDWQEAHRKLLEISAETITRSEASLKNIADTQDRTWEVLTFAQEAIESIRDHAREAKDQLEGHISAVGRLDTALKELSELKVEFKEFTRRMLATPEFHRFLTAEQLDNINIAANKIAMICDKFDDVSKKMDVIPAQTQRVTGEATKAITEMSIHMLDDINKSVEARAEATMDQLKQGTKSALNGFLAARTEAQRVTGAVIKSTETSAKAIATHAQALADNTEQIRNLQGDIQRLTESTNDLAESRVLRLLGRSRRR